MNLKILIEILKAKEREYGKKKTLRNVGVIKQTNTCVMGLSEKKERGRKYIPRNNG